MYGAFFLCDFLFLHTSRIITVIPMAINQTPKRYAFIDVQNTASTTRKLLGFLIDWEKLCAYLKDKWKCEKVFFYSGIDEGDTETAKEFEKLSSNGCIVKSKTVYSYKRPVIGFTFLVQSMS